jgi:hypothetical protein
MDVDRRMTYVEDAAACFASVGFVATCLESKLLWCNFLTGLSTFASCSAAVRVGIAFVEEEAGLDPAPGTIVTSTNATMSGDITSTGAVVPSRHP